MSKTYILQKDLPGIAADTKLYPNGDYYYPERVTDKKAAELKGFCVHKKWVESYPEWFLPEENKSNDSFQWTDRLVCDFLKFTSATGGSIEKFKQSHTPKPQAENKLKSFPEAMAEADRLNPKPRYKVPEEFKAENKPDWEIVELRGKRGRNFIYKKKDGMWLNEFECGWGVDGKEPEGTGCDIWKVKRLSDGEVFSVGDRTTVGEIYSFLIIGGLMDVRCRALGVGSAYPLASIKKLPLQPQKLFTTEDGVDMFEGDECWEVCCTHDAVHYDYLDLDMWDGRTYYPDSYKYFHTKEAAEKYIAENNPQPQKEEPKIGYADWFEKLQRDSNRKKEEQRIEVTGLYEAGERYYWWFTLNKKISLSIEQFPAIKQAIEQVLNDDLKSWNEFTVKYPDIKDKQIRDAIELLVNRGYVVEHQDKFDKGVISWYHPFFTQQQVDAMCEDAFKAGRIVKGNPLAHVRDYPLSAENVSAGQLNLRYKNYEDYKQSKQ